MDVLRSQDFTCVVSALLIFGSFALLFLALYLYDRKAREDDKSVKDKKGGQK